ncbi:unnamed protein product [Enterobius vermicularis]|uniref:Multifunctional methyltransferase subunit TRM112-like protein n=1 Tax=Enterobius vermicularis TaxID=51028 RepID=A0A0N4V9G1_ENTVE|nr:unnamed protein product [Enterobius vermicularis]
MKLMTHNFLSSKFLKGVVNGYPLLLSATKTEVRIKEFDYNEQFVKKIVPRLDYGVLRLAAESVGEAEGLPPQINDGWENDEEFLRKLHRILVSVEVVEGELKCPESGRVFPIREGIPNMLVNENELE